MLLNKCFIVVLFCLVVIASQFIRRASPLVKQDEKLDKVVAHSQQGNIEDVTKCLDEITDNPARKKEV